MSSLTADLRLELEPRALPLAWLAAPAALGLSHLLPATGIGLGLRMAAALACLLVPGAIVSRALGLSGLAPAFTWSLATLAVGMMVMFAVHGSIWLAFGVMLGLSACAVPLALRRPPPRIAAWSLAILGLGLAVGIALWWVAAFGGDSFFHLARVRKLVDFGSISLRSLDEYKDGGLHPGYAFPLWHGLLALVSKLAGADPTQVVLHGPTVLMPLSFLLTYESGVALFRSYWAGLATLLGSFALLGLAPGHGGSFVSLALAANASRMLVLPALLALVFMYVREPSWQLLVSVAAAAGAMTLIHPPHSALILIVLGGFLVVRALMARQDVGAIAAAIAAVAIPTAAVGVWLLPIVRDTVAHNPGAAEVHRAFANYRHELDVFGVHSYRLKPDVFGRGGAAAVAALALLPFAVFARRRLWASFVLGGMLAAFAVTLFAFAFPHLADLLSISQARRLAGFAPKAFALTGAALVLAGLLRWAVLPVALAAGIVLQIVVPGDFGRPYGHGHGGPGWLTWFAFAAAIAAVLAALFADRRLPRIERDGPLAATAVVLFLLPVAVHGFSRWSPPASARDRALARARARARRAAAAEGGRLHRPADRLRARRLSSGLRELDAADPQQRHEGEPPGPPRTRRAAVLPQRRPALDAAPLRRRLVARRPHPRPAHALQPSARLRGWAIRSLPNAMKVLLVTMYFPPAGGGGVQRPLKIATHLPALGIETHVLAPDDPKWIHRDEDLRPPTQAFVHRARYLGPRARMPSEEMHGLSGTDLLLAQAKLAYRRVLLPDASVTWLPTAVPTAVRIVKSEGIDAVITTSPPNSMHLLGASVKRLTGIPWVADFRDAVLGNADRRFDKASVRAKEKALEQVVRLAARSADGIVAVSEPIADEVRSFEPVGQVRVIPNGCDFDDFAGLEYHKGERFRITHTGSFFGQRNPRPFLTALAESGLDDVVARFAGDFRAVDREWVEELGLGERLELLDYVPHREALELQRDSEANLLLLPEAAGRGRVVPSGKIFEYLAAERPILAAVPPDGAAAELVRETGAGVVVAPDDERGLREALAGLHARWRAGKLADGVLSPEQRKRLSRETRVEELAELLWSLQGSR